MAPYDLPGREVGGCKMNEFLAAAFTMPTTIFSWLMILVALYWVTVLAGMMDLGILDGVFDLFDGLFGGAAEGLAEGATEGLAESVGEHHGCLGLSGVPFSIIGSSVVMFGWGFSYFGTKLLAGLLGGVAALVGLGLGATVLATACTAVVLRPVRKMFRIAPVTGRRDLVGRICVVTTLRVDDKFGQAEVDDEGAAILIQARCAQANSFSRGSKALVFKYDAAKEVFYIAPLSEDMAELSERFDSRMG